ncbi:MAG TPA: hypothetical protein VHM30_07595 [Gemmatimonadaceae bacterium]|nr:hypothetical protein [Gemmatimonadaceae bacterium]
MKLRWAALVTVLTLGVMAPRHAAGQGTQPAGDRSAVAVLGQNYPNPFNPTTTIPFTVGDAPTCSDRSRVYRVTLRIYNVLAQLVAIPIMQGTSGSAGQPVKDVALTCGQYTAYWDGNYMQSGREVASGVYLYRLEVDGKMLVRKMIVMK